jgi:hypothetical protein
VALLSREEFDAIEFDAACTGDYKTAAERMLALATAGTQSDSMPRAEAFVRAGEQWLLADNPGAAASGFRMAIADGGPVDVDPRVHLSRALFLLGSADEAASMLADLKTEGHADARTCYVLAELLLEQADLDGALDWATAGVDLIVRGGSGPGMPHDPDPGLDDLLRLRYRIRNDLRLPEDEYDRMLSA